MLPTFRPGRWTLLAVALLAQLSCSDAITNNETDSRTPAEARFLHVTYDYPRLAATEASFWAVKGRTSGAEIWYHARPGAADSSKLVELHLGPASLDRRPDGSAIAVGDSVLITLRVTDPTHMLVDYEPAGLRFAGSDQPLLRMYWTACGDDVNYDGKVDLSDDALIDQFDIWRQESPSGPWFRQPSVVTRATKTVDTRIDGFSGYVIMF